MSARVLVDPNVEPVRHRGVRWYPIGGQWYPSVTSILSATKVEGPQLAEWKRRREGESAAAHLFRTVTSVERWRDAGAERGHAMHAMVERRLLEGVPGEGTWWDSIEHVVERVRRVDGLEVPLVHPELRYASRADLWCEIESGRWLLDAVVDWKSARKRKRRSWIGEHVEQVAAYVVALPICYPDRPRPDHGVVVVATEEHRLRCDACRWEATLTHDDDCPHCGMPTRTLEVRGRPADDFVFSPRDVLAAFDRFAERCEQFHREHEPPDLPIPSPQHAARAAE